MDPETEIYIMLISAYLAIDRFEEALASAQKAIALSPDIKEVMQNYAHCETIAGSLEKAHHILNNLLSKEPEYPPALILLAVIYCLRGENEKMQSIFKILLNRRFNITTCLNTFARSFFLQKNNVPAHLIIKAIVDNNISDNETTKLRQMFAGS